jgi:hypothetical protein
VETASLKLMKQNCFVVMNAATSGMSYWKRAIMAMENSKKHIPYFDKCLNCDEYYARHISTIEMCEPCVEIHTQEFWGMGVPTE